MPTHDAYPRQQALLAQLGTLRREAQLRQPADHRFNLFRLLRPAHDEVRLHSRFLAELLSPAGSHGQGTRFLQLFAQQAQQQSVDFPADFAFGKTTVKREHRRIDLLLDDGRYWLIIENKIYAPDQPRQLARYYQEAIAAGRLPILYYLTLDGHEPADHSTEGLPEEVATQLVNYSDFINEWLTSCVNEVSNLPKLHQAILQYQQLLWQLTGQTMSNEKETVLSLLAQEDYAVHAAALVRNWQHVRHHVEYQFWSELEKLIADHYRVDGEAHFSGDLIHAAIHRQKQRETGYGIKFELGTLRQQPVLFKLHRGEAALVYGLPAKSLPLATAEELAALRLLFHSPEKSWWLTHQVAAGPLDFQAFSNEATVQLANPAARSLAVASLWAEVTQLLEPCITHLQQVFGPDFVLHAGSHNQ